MTVEKLARELDLWEGVVENIRTQTAERAEPLLKQLAGLPIRPSRATRSLGSYVSLGGRSVCIRLQFAQEPDSLRRTLLHEIAHFCDHLWHQSGQRYRQAHGPGWRFWVQALGGTAERLGRSEVLRRLYQQRLKPVAVCQRCGAELQRVRRLNRRSSYLHANCGGRIRPL